MATGKSGNETRSRPTNTITKTGAVLGTISRGPNRAGIFEALSQRNGTGSLTFLCRLQVDDPLGGMAAGLTDRVEKTITRVFTFSCRGVVWNFTGQDDLGRCVQIDHYQPPDADVDCPLLEVGQRGAIAITRYQETPHCYDPLYHSGHHKRPGATDEPRKKRVRRELVNGRVPLGEWPTTPPPIRVCRSSSGV